MEFPPELNKSEVIDETPSPFDIRLNNTYIALYTTNEPIDISVATRFLDEMDDVILRSKSAQDQKRNEKNNKEEYSDEYDGISVLRYRPESHDYHKNQVDAYFRHLDQDETLNSVQKKLSLGYGILKHRFSNYEYRTALWEKFSSLNPDKSDINFVEGAFDILDYRGSSLELRYNDLETEDRIQFTFFFAIRLGTEPISDIDDFLNYHLSHNFGGDVKKFTRFLELTCTEYKEQLISEERCEVVKNWKSDVKSYSTPVIQDNTKVDELLFQSSESKGGNKRNVLSIPVTVKRTSTDHLTELTAEETAMLFEYLQKVGILLQKDETILSGASMSKAVQILTGYSTDSITEKLQLARHKPATKRILKSALQKIIDLINKELGVKSPPHNIG